MAQGDVPRSQVIVGLQQLQVLSDGIAVLDADEHGPFSKGLETHRVIRSERQFGQVMMRANRLVDRVEQTQSEPPGPVVVFRLPTSLRQVHGEKHSVQSTLFHTRQIDLSLTAARIVACPEIEFRFQNSERRVDMRIHRQHALVDPRRFLGHRFIHLRAGGNGEQSIQQQDMGTAAGRTPARSSHRILRT